MVAGQNYWQLDHLINSFTLPKVGADHEDQDKLKQLGAN
jgi:hypothetical protein